LYGKTKEAAPAKKYHLMEIHELDPEKRLEVRYWDGSAISQVKEWNY
jgi:hypothetical protein